MKKANFLYIGPGRAGSTWLYSAFWRHPQVFVPLSKDIYFFDKEYGRGIEWYEAFFKKATEKEIAVGEISHDYMFSPQAPERIFRYNPKMKLLMNLRDPVERLVSRYNFEVFMSGAKKSDLITFSKNNRFAIEEGMYCKYINRYLEYFEKDQLGIFDFHTLESDAYTYINQVLRFLACDEDFDRTDLLLHKKVFASNVPRLRIVNRVLALMAKGVRKCGLPTVVAMGKFSKPLEKIIFSRKPVNTELTEKESKYFKELYQKDVEGLGKIISPARNSFKWVLNYV